MEMGMKRGVWLLGLSLSLGMASAAPGQMFKTAKVPEGTQVHRNTDQSSRVQAVVDWFGPTDVAKMGGMHDNTDSPESRLLGGPVQKNRDKAERANPIAYVSKDDPPFLIMHGDRDKMVPFNQSELLYDALKKVGVDATLKPVKGAGHGTREFGSAESMKSVEDFFAEHLKKRTEASR
jgi:dipeptidyl aminopeptidase/acylaminoacyl peptidase